MIRFFKILWHGFWYKHYHFPRTVVGMRIGDNNRIYYEDIEYHQHQVERAYVHGMEYGRLAPDGLTKFADKVLKERKKCEAKENAMKSNPDGL